MAADNLRDDPARRGGIDMERFRDTLRLQLEWGFRPLAVLLMRFRVSANQVTIAGALLNVGAAVLVVTENLVAAGIVYLIAGAFDLLDGLLARLSERVTHFGAFLDSTIDRISEGLVLAAIAYHFARRGEAIGASFVVLALLGSFLVSYVRARAEALGAQCKVGVLTRAERVVLLTLGLLLDVLTPVIYVLVALTAFTVGQRIHHVARQIRDRD